MRSRGQAATEIALPRPTRSREWLKVAGVALVGELAGYPYLLWLVTSMYGAMCLGMSVLLRLPP